MIWKRTPLLYFCIKRDDYLYREVLSWMSHRYAIGITEYLSRNGKAKQNAIDYSATLSLTLKNSTLR